VADALRTALRRLSQVLSAVFGLLTKFVTVVTAMEILGFSVRERIATAATGLRTRGREAGQWLRHRLAALDDMQERGDRESTGGSDTQGHGEDGR